MADPENIQVNLTPAEARALVGLVRRLEEAGWHDADDGNTAQSRSSGPTEIEEDSFSRSEIQAARERLNALRPKPKRVAGRSS